MAEIDELIKFIPGFRLIDGDELNKNFEFLAEDNSANDLYLGAFVDDTAAELFAASQNPPIIIIEGTMYFNSSIEKLKIYSAGVFVPYDESAQQAVISSLVYAMQSQMYASQAAASAALVAAGFLVAGVYTSTALGLAGTTNGQFFYVADGLNPAIVSILYRNTAGIAVQYGIFSVDTAISNSTHAQPSDTVDVEHDSNLNIASYTSIDGTRNIDKVNITGAINDLPSADFKAAIDSAFANAEYRGDRGLRYNYNLVMRYGQSNSIGADSQLVYSRPVQNIRLLMFDLIREGQYGGTKFTAFQTAVEQNITVLGFQYGETGVLAGMEMIERLIAERNRSPLAVSNKKIIGIAPGISSTSLADLSNTSGLYWTLLKQSVQAMKTLTPVGQTCSFLGMSWAQGAQDYTLSTTGAAYTAGLMTMADNLQTLALYTDQGSDPVWTIIEQNHAHPQRGYPNNPYLAEAQADAAAQHPYIRMGQTQYSQLGSPSASQPAGSYIHNSGPESDRLQAAAMWALTSLAVWQEDWDNFSPVSVRLISSNIIEIVWDVMRGYTLDWYTNPNVPTMRQASAAYGFYVYDPTPATPIVISGLPYFTARDTMRINLAAPGNVGTTSVIYARGQNGGNLIQRPTNDVYAVKMNIYGTDELIVRHAPIFNQVVTA